jgi:hypothetical protein
MTTNHDDRNWQLSEEDPLGPRKSPPFSKSAAQTEAEEDAYVIERLSKLLAGVATALRGPELPLHRHSYHDLPERAQTIVLERDLLRLQVEELRAAPQAQPVAPEAVSTLKRFWNGAWWVGVTRQEAIDINKAFETLSAAPAQTADLPPLPEPEVCSVLIHDDDGDKHEDCFTGKQMHEYARAAIAAASTASKEPKA